MGDKINIMNEHFKKIKISFSVIILLFIVGIAGGSFAMKDNNFFTGKQLLQIINYLNYKFSFANTNNKNLTAAIISIFGNNNSVFVSNNNAKSIPVLLYHGIIDKPDGANVLLEDFKNQMFALKKDGWQTVGIEDFYKFMKGEKELPDKSFLLTFDDGRKDSYYPVDPILKVLGYRAVIFVITGGSLGEDNNEHNFHLSKNELKKMVKSRRWDIQAHAKEGHDFFVIDVEGNKGHFYSNKLWLEDKGRIETEEEFKKRITDDFIGAKNDIKQNLEIDSLSFAYPFGDFGQESINFPQAESIILDTIKEIYPVSFYQTWTGKGFYFNYPYKNLFLAKRISVSPNWTAENLLKILENGRNKDLPYFDNFTDYNGWVKTWGRLTLNDNQMILNSFASTTGSAAFLDGSYLWKDYVFKTKIDWVHGENISLIARFKDNSNYVSCSFNDKKIRIEQYLNGDKRIMVEKEITFEISKKDLELGIAVNNDKTDCLINGKSAVYSYYLSPNLLNGGIGFKTWDPKINNSEIIIKEVKVEEIKYEENTIFTAVSEKYGKKELILDKKQNITANNIVKEETKSVSYLPLTASIVQSVAEPAVEIKVKEIEKALPIYLPYFIKEFNITDKWKSLWGEFFIKNNLLHISSGNSAVSGFTVLEGSDEWTDYLFKTKIDFIKGTSFSLVARYKDAKNYVFCSFSNYGKTVAIYQVLNGETKTLGRTPVLPVPYFTPWLDLNFSIKADRNNIECLINDNWALKDKIDASLKSGGIGFKIWGDKMNSNEVIVKEINVK